MFFVAFIHIFIRLVDVMIREATIKGGFPPMASRDVIFLILVQGASYLNLTL